MEWCRPADRIKYNSKSPNRAAKGSTLLRFTTTIHFAQLGTVYYLSMLGSLGSIWGGVWARIHPIGPLNLLLAHLARFWLQAKISIGANNVICTYRVSLLFCLRMSEYRKHDIYLRQMLILHISSVDKRCPFSHVKSTLKSNCGKIRSRGPCFSGPRIWRHAVVQLSG